MSILASIRRQVVPVHPEGYIFITAFAIATLILAWLWRPFGWVGALLTVWCVYFFRDPPRVTPRDDALVVAPADGIVCSVGTFVPPPEMGLGALPLRRVSIFMSVFDCHVNRSPVSGRIAKIAYRPGLFVNADLDKASEDNERNSFLIETPAGTFGMVQIAGLIARRIVCFTTVGAAVAAGERLGLIRFGSRVDVYLPDKGRPLVSVGSKTVAGETVIADLRGGELPRSFVVS